jgi:pterin-4a-carbinolamine dehydratase
VAPATYNTINKWAQGTSDTYALGILAEMTGMDTPIVVLPFVNSALAGRVAFRRSTQTLASEGVRILLGPGGFEPHPPRTGADRTETFPWHLALDEADRLAGERTRLETSPATPSGAGTAWAATVASRDVIISATDLPGRLAAAAGWHGDTTGISKTYAVGYDSAIQIAGEIGRAAIELEHRPDIDIRWDRLTVNLTTHTAGDAVTELDFRLLARIDAIAVSHGVKPS